MSMLGPNVIVKGDDIFNWVRGDNGRISIMKLPPALTVMYRERMLKEQQIHREKIKRSPNAVRMAELKAERDAFKIDLTYTWEIE